MAVILELNQPKESETWLVKLGCPIPIYICSCLYFYTSNSLHSLLDNISIYILYKTSMSVWHIVLLTIHRLDKLHSHCLCPESTLQGPAYNTDFFLTSYDLTQSTSRAPISLVVPSGSLWFCRPLANSEKANKNFFLFKIFSKCKGKKIFFPNLIKYFHIFYIKAENNSSIFVVQKCPLVHFWGH